MSGTMLHGILQMPPELWTNDAIDIAQRHGRYLEASKRIIELERERDEARRERDSALKERDAVWNSWSKALDEAREELTRVRKDLVASNRGAETNAKVNQGLCAKLAEAERERDEARRELDAVEALLEEYDHRFNCSESWSQSDTLGKVDFLIKGYIILHGDSLIQRRKHE